MPADLNAAEVLAQRGSVVWAVWGGGRIGRNVLDAAAWTAAGWQYQGLGVPNPAATDTTPMVELLTSFTRTPVSQTAMVVFLVVGVVMAQPLASRRGWRPAGVAITIWGVGVALVPTFVARIGSADFVVDPAAVTTCVGGWQRAWSEPESLLNLLLLVPIGVGVAWACRSWRWAAAWVLIVGLSIEIAQSVSHAGTCEHVDIARNVTGGWVAAGAAWLASRRCPTGRSSEIEAGVPPVLLHAPREAAHPREGGNEIPRLTSDSRRDVPPPQ